MKVFELSKELGINNKELITFLKEKGYKVSSHMQSLTEEMIDVARENFKTAKVAVVEEVEEAEEVVVTTKKDIAAIIPETKTFKPDDLIPCRSVTPWKLVTVGVDKATVYNWNGYGDIDYVAYKDLQALRRKDLITKPKVIIEDADLCYQWRKELGDTYKYFLGVEYPEEFFDLPDNKFKQLLTDAPDVVKEVIKTTAMNMVRNENYPTVQKLSLIDDILGTCIKDFL